MLAVRFLPRNDQPKGPRVARLKALWRDEEFTPEGRIAAVVAAAAAALFVLLA